MTLVYIVIFQAFVIGNLTGGLTASLSHECETEQIDNK